MKCEFEKIMGIPMEEYINKKFKVRLDEIKQGELFLWVDDEMLERPILGIMGKDYYTDLKDGCSYYAKDDGSGYMPMVFPLEAELEVRLKIKE